MSSKRSTKPGTPSPEAIERELRAINLLAHESGWDRPPSLYVIQAEDPDPDDQDPVMTLMSVKMPLDDEAWGSLGHGDPILGLYVVASRLMDSIMGPPYPGFPEQILDPLIERLPVAIAFLNENYSALPEALALLKPGQRFGDLPTNMRKEQRSLHGLDSQGQVFNLNHTRSEDDAEYGEIEYQHIAQMESGLRGYGRLPICLKMILDACEAHWIMKQREGGEVDFTS